MSDCEFLALGLIGVGISFILIFGTPKKIS